MVFGAILFDAAPRVLATLICTVYVVFGSSPVTTVLPCCVCASYECLALSSDTPSIIVEVRGFVLPENSTHQLSVNPVLITFVTSEI